MAICPTGEQHIHGQGEVWRPGQPDTLVASAFTLYRPAPLARGLVPCLASSLVPATRPSCMEGKGCVESVVDKTNHICGVMLSLGEG